MESDQKKITGIWFSGLVEGVKRFVLSFIYQDKERDGSVIFCGRTRMEIPIGYHNVVKEFVNQVVVNICTEAYEHSVDASYIKEIINGFFLKDVIYEQDMSVDAGYRIGYTLVTLSRSITDAFVLLQKIPPQRMYSRITTHSMVETLTVMLWKKHKFDVEYICDVPLSWSVLASNGYTIARRENSNIPRDCVLLELYCVSPLILEKGVVKISNRPFKGADIICGRYMLIRLQVIEPIVCKPEHTTECMKKIDTTQYDDDAQDIVNELYGKVVILSNRNVKVKGADVLDVLTCDDTEYENYHLILYHLGSCMGFLKKHWIDLISNALTITILEASDKCDSYGDVGNVRSELKHFTDSVKRHTYKNMVSYASNRKLLLYDLYHDLQDKGHKVYVIRNVERFTYRGWAIRILNNGSYPFDNIKFGYRTAISRRKLMSQLSSIDDTWVIKICKLKRCDLLKIKLMDDEKAYNYLRTLKYLK